MTDYVAAPEREPGRPLFMPRLPSGVSTKRMALWTRHSAAAGRSLGERLKSLDWASAARSGRRSR